MELHRKLMEAFHPVPPVVTGPEKSKAKLKFKKIKVKKKFK